jgi:hypothetical protein
MKLKTELEITPEEARKLMGMPEYSWLQECENVAKDQEWPSPLGFNSIHDWHYKYNPFYNKPKEDDNA